MKRIDIIKLNFVRNWNLPGKTRLVQWFKLSADAKASFNEGIVLLNTEDIALYTSADNYIEWTILNTGTYENEIGQLIKLSLREGDNALDIGANIGLQSLRMSARVGSPGKVYAFEPLAHLQEKFHRNIGLNRADNVTLLPFALSDQNNEAEFNIDVNSWNQGTFSLSGSSGSNTQKVMIRTGDSLPEIQALNDLALLKIDVEGFEFPVLSGLKNTLKRHKPRIIFEYDVQYWTINNYDINLCYTFLQDLGYQLYQINPAGAELIRSASGITPGNLFCICP